MMTQFLGRAGLGSAVIALALGLASGPARAEEPRPDGGMPPTAPPVVEAKDVVGAVAVTNDAWLQYDNPALRYEQPRYAGDARLYVRESGVVNRVAGANAPATYRWRVYRGRDLDVITRSNAQLAANAEMAGLRTYLATSSKAAPSSLRVLGAVRTSYEAPGLVYEPARQGSARLFVRESDGRESMYLGSDFDSIVLANPSLEQTVGFPAFRTRIQRDREVRPWTLRRDSQAIFHVNYRPTNVMVATHEWRDGAWVTHTHEGSTLAEIEASQPSLRGMLSDERANPLTVAPGVGAQPMWQVETFGVTLATPPSCLDSQLNLTGRGVLVTKVVAGSSAETLGLRSDDVILDYDGRPVTDGEWVRSQFNAWRSDSRATLVVLRRGSRVTLTR